MELYIGSKVQEMNAPRDEAVLGLTAEIVSSYVSNNAVQATNCRH